MAAIVVGDHEKGGCQSTFVIDFMEWFGGVLPHGVSATWLMIDIFYRQKSAFVILFFIIKNHGYDFFHHHEQTLPFRDRALYVQSV